MIAVDVHAGDRRGRVFFAREDQALPSPKILADFSHSYFEDDDDIERDKVLRKLLEQPIIHADVHPSVDPEDVKHVFFRGAPGTSFFACVIISQNRLAEMLKCEPFVYENFVLQVSPLQAFSVDALRTAIEAWCERNYPGISLPSFVVAPWVDPDHYALLRELIDQRHRQVRDGLPSEVQPDVTVLEPAYEAA